MIESLINKLDTFEHVRNKIAVILATEVENQKALAMAAGIDPAPWDMQIVLERSNPFEKYLNEPVSEQTPIVNIWFDSSSFDKSKGNTVDRQASQSVFNIDCYANGVAQELNGGGHIPGDEASALRVQRTVALVRNIIMSACYTYLDMRGIVWQRWFGSIQQFQPQIDNGSAQKITGARLPLSVLFNEFSPQFEGEELEKISIDVLRARDGSILAEADYNYPLTP